MGLLISGRSAPLWKMSLTRHVTLWFDENAKFQTERKLVQVTDNESLDFNVCVSRCVLRLLYNRVLLSRF